jgi:hypothetical protein
MIVDEGEATKLALSEHTDSILVVHSSCIIEDNLAADSSIREYIKRKHCLTTALQE